MHFYIKTVDICSWLCECETYNTNLIRPPIATPVRSVFLQDAQQLYKYMFLTKHKSSRANNINDKHLVSNHIRAAIYSEI